MKMKNKKNSTKNEENKITLDKLDVKMTECFHFIFGENIFFFLLQTLANVLIF